MVPQKPVKLKGLIIKSMKRSMSKNMEVTGVKYTEHVHSFWNNCIGRTTVRLN